MNFVSELATHWVVFFMALIFPFLSWVCCSVFPQKKKILMVSVLFHLLSFGLFILLCFQYDFLPINHEIPWFYLGSQPVNLIFLLSKKTLTLATLASGLSLSVHIYSLYYMWDDDRVFSYFGNLGFFTFCMVGLALSDHLIMIFFFWEWVGFFSYRLIGHTFEKLSSASASTRVLITNRIADMGFIAGMILIWLSTGSLSISELSHGSIPDIAFIFLFISILGKSAQFPFSGWLLKAMHGPVPVSALIHSATMVAAGVFLLWRLEFAISESMLVFVLWLSGASSILSGVAALLTFDLKKILAFSTISQLGLIMMGVSIHDPVGVQLYLIHHACFKAGLFLIAGIIIRDMAPSDLPDIRLMSGVVKRHPLIFWMGIIYVSALAGLPFTSGFISKEWLLDKLTFSAFGSVAHLGGAVMAWVSTFLASLYAFRIFWYVFSERPQRSIFRVLKKSQWIPLCLLATGVVSIITSVYPFRGISFYSFLFQVTTTESVAHVAYFSLLSLAISAGVSFIFYRHRPRRTWANPIEWMDRVMGHGLIYTTQQMSWISVRTELYLNRFLHMIGYVNVGFSLAIGWIDRYVVDYVIVGRSIRLMGGIGLAIRWFMTGKIQVYLVCTLILFLLCILWIYL